MRAPGARGGKSGAAVVGAGVACGEGDGKDELGAEDVGEVPGRRRGMGSLPGDRREIRRWAFQERDIPAWAMELVGTARVTPAD